MIHVQTYIYVNLLITTLQSAAIGYLIGIHLAQRKSIATLIKIHRNPSYIVSPNTDDSGHIHMVLPQGHQ